MPGPTLILFEVVHRRLQQRQCQHLERTGLVFENAQFQGLFQLHKRLVDIQFHREPVL
ncbi:hypothetical protein D3C75_1249220 [compost metagenome]